MATVASGLELAFARVGEFVLVEEHPGCDAVPDDFDLVIRSGWRKDRYETFGDATFIRGTTSEPDRNALFVSFDASMLAEKSLMQIADTFGYLLCDSSFSAHRAQAAGLRATQLVTHPALLISQPRVRAGDEVDYRFLHVSKGSEMYRVKGVDLILEAWQRAFPPQAKAHLTLAITKPGSAESDLGQALDVFREQKRLHQISIAPGNKTRSEMATLYAAHDCYVFASRTETFGLPALEAAASGLYVVMHTQMGARDFAHISHTEVAGTWRPMPANSWRANAATDWFELNVDELAQALVDAMTQRPQQLASPDGLMSDFGVAPLEHALAQFINLAGPRAFRWR